LVIEETVVSQILIYGIDSVLGSYCAARLLQNHDCRIFYYTDADPIDLVMHAASQIIDIADQAEIEGRLCPVIATTHIDEAWYFAGLEAEEGAAAEVEQFIAAWAAMGGSSFNYVCSSGKADQKVAELCRVQGISCRIFRTSLIVDKELSRFKNSDAFAQFLKALYSFKAEIEERSPQYFDFHALRCFAPADSTLNLVPAAVASELLVRIAGIPRTAGSSFWIANPQSISFSTLCENISIAYGLGLLPTEDFGALNAIDRTFHDRVSGFYDHFTGASEISAAEAYRIAGVLPESSKLDEDRQIELLDAIAQCQREMRAAHEQHIAELPTALERKTISINNSELTYFTGGSAGPAVVVLNALGQGLEFWYRLTNKLIEAHRVIIWEPRGTVSPQPPFALRDQVNDLDEILRNEEIEIAHLVGWCTGPKVAVDFYLLRPKAVQSMAFLNGTFKCDGSPEELNTPYEKNLEFLCRRLVQKPALAASIMKSFQARADESETEVLQGADSEQVSLKVLSSINVNLKSAVLAPFGSEETTLNYAHQLVDFWANDVRPKAANVQAPVLLISSEYDEIVSSASAHMAVGLFPNAQHVHIAAATHYCLYDRPDLIADLLAQFFKDSSETSVLRSVEEEVAIER
jgi:pimeloyl-ACP methyl ester carboxylesterase